MACGCHSDVSYPLELINIIQHNDDTYSFDFISNEPMHWYEGDSSKLMLNVDGRWISRKLSYATLPNEKVARFTTRIRSEKSAYKERLHQLTVGEYVRVTAPSGHFNLQRIGRPALLVSNGVGIATMRSLIKAFSLDASGIDYLTQINVDRTGHIFKEEMDELMAKTEKFSSLYVDNRDTFYSKLDYECQQLMLKTGVLPVVYIVGSDGFVMDVMSHLIYQGFGQADILTDGPIRSLSGGCGCGSSSTTSCGTGCSCAG